MSELNKEKVLLLVDESYGNNFCGVCIVCVQGSESVDILRDQLRRMSVDPTFIAYNTSPTFHYADDSIGARQSLASRIFEMPISVYCAISQKDIPSSREKLNELAYKNLFPSLLKPLRMKFGNRLNKRVDFTIHFENLTDKPDIDLSFFKNISACQDTDSIKVVTKSDPLIFLPDYFLGFIREHLKDRSEGGSRKSCFKTLANKFGLLRRTKPIQRWPIDSLKLLSGKIGLILLSNQGDETRYERGEGVANFLS